MHQIIQNFKTGELKVESVPPPAISAGRVLVQNACSLISAGTERMALDLARKSLLGKARERPDLVRQVLAKIQRDGLFETLQTVRNRLETTMPLGYSCAGTVLSVGPGISDFASGVRVACAGAGYASHAEIVSIPQNLAVALPNNVAFEHAAFTTLGAIALQGLRVAEVHLGENIGVIGLGLVGQLTVQLLNAAGCNVFGIDVQPSRIDLARQLGAQDGSSPAEAHSAVAAFTHNHGLDAVLIAAATDSNAPIELAGELCREKGRVVAIGAVKMDVPRRVFYQKELDLRLSRSYGPGRYDPQYEEKGIDYPYGYVRWTEKRNMEAFVTLLAQQKINVTPLITHRFPIADALQAYNLISEPAGAAKRQDSRRECSEASNSEPYLGILLTYPDAPTAPPSSKITLRTLNSELRTDSPHSALVSLSIIGAGLFAQSTLLPALKKVKGVHLRGIVTGGGLSARTTGNKYGFDYCASNADDILNDETTNAVLIATRHNLHASLAIQALKANKHVFVEKPLALSETELQNVVQTAMQSNRILMVGFNRRFALLVQHIKTHLQNRREPLALTYRINAGAIPRDHWTQDPHEGGGRIIGEVCHFIDLMTYLCNAHPISVFAQTTAPTITNFNNDTLAITLSFSDGSIGAIQYYANGDTSSSKERLEVFCEKSIAILEDFRLLTFTTKGRTKKHKTRQDKGHRAELQAFINAIKSGAPAPIPFADLIAVTRTTFAIHEALRTGSPVPVKAD